MNINDKKNNLTKDELLVDYIKDQLEEKMQASAMDINVIVRDGVAEIFGFVDVLSEKNKAEKISREIKGIRKIENNITVVMDSNFTDKHIEKELISKFRKSKNHDKISGISIKVHDGAVDLIGETRNLKNVQTAMKIASQTRGVKNVVNNIKISPDENFDDISIKNRINKEFMDNNLSNIGILCDVTNGKVTLSGIVSNKSQMELAKELTASVDGVTKIKNLIKTRK